MRPKMIPCNRMSDCCQIQDYNRVRPLIQTNDRWITFANLLSNGNWSKTVQEINKLSNDLQIEVKNRLNEETI